MRPAGVAVATALMELFDAPACRLHDLHQPILEALSVASDTVRGLQDGDPLELLPAVCRDALPLLVELEAMVARARNKQPASL